MKRGTIVLAVILGVLLYISLNVYLFKNPVRFGAKQPDYLEVPYNRFGYPEEEVSRVETRLLLESREYEKLNDLLISIQGNFERDFTNEYRMHDALLSFHHAVPEFESLFDDWVRAFPDTFPPYLGRAYYYWAMGAESRGGAWAKDTSEDQFEGMRRYYGLALDDLENALNLNPRLVSAYSVRISINKNFSRDRENYEDITKALAIAPECFLPRYFYMNALEPRWGGSFSSMNSFAREAQRYAEKNPALEVLKGYAYGDRAYSERCAKRYGRAIKFYNKALKYGNDYTLLSGRAHCYYALKEYEKAERDIDHALALRGQVPDGWDLRSRVHYTMGRFDEAYEDLSYARSLAPGDESILSLWEWQAKNHMQWGHKYFKDQLDRAIERYGWCLKMNPENTEACYWRGLALFKQGRKDEAERDIERAIELNPRNFESYRMMDRILFDSGRLNEILFYWNRYLQLEPENADAYFERSGTYLQMSDVVSAIRDLEKSCKLGNDRACARLEKVGGKRDKR